MDTTADSGVTPAPFITQRELARVLDMSLDAFRVARHRGTITVDTTTHGGRTLITRTSAEALVGRPIPITEAYGVHPDS